MKEINFNEIENTFYLFDEDEELFYEAECLTAVEFDENLMEITEIKELDFKDDAPIILSESDTYSAAYEIEELKDGEKLSVTMFKVQMPNDEILSIPVLSDERAEFISSNGYSHSYTFYDNNEKREATDEEIDMIE